MAAHRNKRPALDHRGILDTTSSLATKSPSSAPSTPASASTAATPSTSKWHISQLPAELAFLILTHVPYRALAALSRVDRYWRQLTLQQDCLLWYKLCQRYRFLSPDTSSSTLNRITLHDAQQQHPGLARALQQSRRHMASRQTRQTSVSTSTLKRHVPTSWMDQASLEKEGPSESAAMAIQASELERGRVRNWKEYFVAMLMLEREWIEGKPLIKELHGHTEAVLSIRILPERDRIVSGDRLGHLTVWCALTGACLKTFKHHMMGISCLAVRDDILVSGSWDSTVIVWRQLQEAPYLRPLKIVDLGEQVMSMELTSDMELVIGAVTGMVKIISLKTFSSIDTFRSPFPHLCTAVTLHRTKIEAAIGHNYYAWDRSSHAQVGFIGGAHFETISCMKVDTHKRLIFTGSQDSKVRVFSWESKPMLLRQYGGHRGGVRCMALQDSRIITGSSDKVCLITFRDRHETLFGFDAVSLEGSQGPRDSLLEDAERVAEPVALSHPANVNAVDADASIIVTGADDGLVRIFDFGHDLWRPPTPSSPRLCGQASLISSTSSTCVLMARPGRNKVSVGNRRQTWGTCALAVLTRARSISRRSIGHESADPAALVWMNVDEIYQRMMDWELQPVSQGSTPKHTLNLALHMMAKSDPPTILLDSTVSPHRFALK
ncbi:hypothetical protein EDD11_003839 [Mortierella claussenii]|nr:hypothetical protein EDD11_003839 [Mortierella claussenii]